jgi:antagonist of KipI
MDPCAHRLANAMIGNPADAAALEIALVGPDLEFEDERIVVATGAEIELGVDGHPQQMNTPFVVPSGATLHCGGRRRGARAYLGIAGGIATPLVFRSRATHVPSGLGCVDGRALRAGDRVPLGEPRQYRRPAVGRVPFEPPDGHATVRVLPGPQIDRFAPDVLDTLRSRPYTLDARSDRMGFRLQGPVLAHAGDAEMLSEATCLGGLQVPAGGQPILLMADRQTTGGYPMVAAVISADIHLAAQLAAGDTISIVPCTFREAIAALIAQEQALMAFESNRGR